MTTIPIHPCIMNERCIVQKGGKRPETKTEPPGRNLTSSSQPKNSASTDLACRWLPHMARSVEMSSGRCSAACIHMAIMLLRASHTWWSMLVAWYTSRCIPFCVDRDSGTGGGDSTIKPHIWIYDMRTLVVLQRRWVANIKLMNHCSNTPPSHGPPQDTLSVLLTGCACLLHASDAGINKMMSQDGLILTHGSCNVENVLMINEMSPVIPLLILYSESASIVQKEGFRFWS